MYRSPITFVASVAIAAMICAPAMARTSWTPLSLRETSGTRPYVSVSRGCGMSSIGHKRTSQESTSRALPGCARALAGPDYARRDGRATPAIGRTSGKSPLGE
jgi:hypothetical protein